MSPTYAELHSHTNFSFLHGASPVEDMAERAAELGLSGPGRHGPRRAVRRGAIRHRGGGGGGASGHRDRDRAPGLRRRPTPAARASRRRRRGSSAPARRRAPATASSARAAGRGPAGATATRPRPTAGPPRGGQGGPARDRRAAARAAPRAAGAQRDGLSEPVPARLPRESRRDQARAAVHPGAARASTPRACVALSGGREGEIARRLRVGDREGARAVAERYATLFGDAGRSPRDGVVDRGLLHRAVAPPAARRRLARRRARRPRRRARPAGRRDERRPLRPTRGSRAARRPDRDLPRPDARDPRRPAPARWRVVPEVRRPSSRAAARPARRRLGRLGERVARAWAEGIATAGEIAASCSVDLGFEQYRFPGFPVPKGETAFSYLSELCWAGARRRYHPLTSAVVNRLAHELDVIERAGLAEFFLICWDLMRFAKEQGIPAQGRGSATSSIVSYTLGISRVEPIAHNLLFERFINEGRTTYPDVDIDFSLRAARGGHPVHLPALRPGAHRDGLQPRDLPGSVGGPGGRATRWGSRGRWWIASRRRSRRTTASWSGATSRPTAASPSSSGGRARALPSRGRDAVAAERRRGARLRRRDGPAQHARAARRQGAAVAPAAEARRTRTRPGPSPGSGEVPLGADAGALAGGRSADRRRRPTRQADRPPTGQSHPGLELATRERVAGRSVRDAPSRKSSRRKRGPG